MQQSLDVNAKRIYLTGHSMGGAGTLFLASTHADILKGKQKADLPLMIVQGDADTVVPPTNTRMWVDTAKELGLKDFQYVEQPGIDHGSVITSSQKDVFEFFAAHKKK